MSRNSKQAKKKVLAKQFTAIRKGGGNGSAKTTPKHGKKATYNALKKAKRAVKQSASSADAVLAASVV
jgi:hypothetical protein